jgi:membrane-associated protease RseP (regulator of RpoE activity)
LAGGGEHGTADRTEPVLFCRLDRPAGHGLKPDTVGQLDGGHALFAVFGEKVHRWTGFIAFLVMASLSIMGILFYNSPSGFLIAVILGIMMRIRHPSPFDTTPLDAKRKVVAVLTLVIFVLCFMPFPIHINY